MTEDIHMLLGSYVLGGLSAEDRRAFDEHLEGCPRCRMELAEAAPLPALLRKVSGVPALADFPIVVEPSLGNLLAAERARRRRRSRVQWLAAAAAVVIAFGGGAAVITVTHDQQPTSVAQGKPPAQGQAPETDEGRLVALRTLDGSTASGRVGLKKKVWGTAIWLQVADMPTTGVFTIWATDDTGHRELAGSWAGTPSGRCILDGATSIATDHLAKVSVVGPDSSVVAVAQPT
jgi:predicted anti-sigma-YlaC factor YlaD